MSAALRSAPMDRHSPVAVATLLFACGIPIQAHRYAHYTGIQSLSTALRSAPMDRLLASGSADWTIRLWDVYTGEHLHTLEGHLHYVYTIAFSADGRILASGSADNTIHLWNPHTGAHLRTLYGHTESVGSVAFSRGGSFASGSHDDTIRLWNAYTGEHLHTLEGHTAAVSSVAFSPDGTTLASCGSWEDGTIRLWDMTRLWDK